MEQKMELGLCRRECWSGEELTPLGKESQMGIHWDVACGRQREEVLLTRREFLMASSWGTGCGADWAEEGKKRKAAPVEGTQQDEAHGKVVQRRNQSFFLGSDGEWLGVA